MNGLHAITLLGLLILGSAAALAMAPADSLGDQDKSVGELIDEAKKALLARRPQESVELATKALGLDQESSEAYRVRGRARQQLRKFDDAIADFDAAIKRQSTAESFAMRGECYSALDRHRDAIADFDRALQLDAKLILVLHHRGRERFKNGEIDQSIADFDRAIELDPSHKNDCWERGLSRYYAGQFAKAQESFEDYHKVGPGDIENGLWRMISQAEVAGLAAAQKDLFEYEPKRRPPFPLAYELYAGRSKPEFVMDHALDGASDDDDRRTRTFYAHLYVGLWFVANRDRAQALDHLEEAVALRSQDYMWYVAREHLKRLKEKRN